MVVFTQPSLSRFFLKISDKWGKLFELSVPEPLQKIWELYLGKPISTARTERRTDPVNAKAYRPVGAKLFSTLRDYRGKLLESRCVERFMC
jgi:hypothetical protein